MIFYPFNRDVTKKMTMKGVCVFGWPHDSDCEYNAENLIFTGMRESATCCECEKSFKTGIIFAGAGYIYCPKHYVERNGRESFVKRADAMIAAAIFVTHRGPVIADMIKAVKSRLKKNIKNVEKIIDEIHEMESDAQIERQRCSRLEKEPGRLQLILAVSDTKKLPLVFKQDDTSMTFLHQGNKMCSMCQKSPATGFIVLFKNEHYCNDCHKRNTWCHIIENMIEQAKFQAFDRNYIESLVADAFAAFEASKKKIVELNQSIASKNGMISDIEHQLLSDKLELSRLQLILALIP